MADRPSYLILVTHQGQKGVEIFSAHYTEEDASKMHARLGALLATTGSVVHLVEVPEIEGLVSPDKASCRRIEPKDDPQASKPAPAPVQPPSSMPLTQEEYEEQARQLAKGNGPRDGFRDDKYAGAFS